MIEGPTGCAYLLHSVSFDVSIGRLAAVQACGVMHRLQRLMLLCQLVLQCLGWLGMNSAQNSAWVGAASACSTVSQTP